MNYNNSRSRRIGSMDILNGIKDYYKNIEIIKSRASNALSNLYDDNYTDYKYRTICINCSEQISKAYEEGNQLVGMTLNYNNTAARWLKVNNLDLKKYTFDVDEIRDLNNNLYTETFRDIEGVWKLFKTYSQNRDSNLNDWEDVFDDGYVRQRNTTDAKITYSEVIGSVRLEKLKLYVDKPKVVKDLKISNKETDPAPRLPAASDFKTMMTIKNNYNNAKYYMELINNFQLKKTAQDDSWFADVKFSSDSLNGNILTIDVHDASYSEQFVDTVIHKLSKYLFFKGKNDSYVVAALSDKRKVILDHLNIKDAYEPNYKGANNHIKNSVYDYYKDIYYNNKYAARLTLWIEEQKINSSCDLILSETITDSIMVTIIKNLADKAVDKITTAYNTWLSADENIRCMEADPEIFYTDIINKFRNANYRTVDGCKILQSYMKEAINWCDTRGNELLSMTIDNDNANKLINALSKRLNKNNGTLMLWYQSLISIDQEKTASLSEEKVVRLSSKQMLVTTAVDAADLQSFSHQPNPKFIDINIPDNFFTSSFKKGDKIYIVDNVHAEFSATVTNVYNVKINSTNYNDMNIESISNGGLEKEINKQISCYRLELDKRLPNYYCYDNDVSTLRIMKLLKS